MPRVKNKVQTVASVEAELLKRVRLHGRISRVELSRELNIVPSTAGIYVDRLISEGFLVELPQAERSLGRPPTLLALNPNGGRFVGVDFEARNLMATAVDFSQQPLRQVHQSIRASDSVEQILGKMERAIGDVMAGDARPVLGIGAGIPGVIDTAHGVAVRYNFIRGWQDIPLSARLRKKFGVPVFLENNIRCMALAELWFGGGRGLKDFVCLGVRSGVAAGVIANGQLLRGISNQAGEIGHWSVPVPVKLKKPVAASTNGECLWQPGVRLEQVASLSAILSLAQRLKDDRQKTALARVKGELTMDDFFEAIRKGDAFARSLIESVACVYGWVVCQLCALFDPQKIIFSGLLAELGEVFLAPVRAAAAQWGGAKLGVAVTYSALGNYNGALGAAALALHQWKPKR